LRCKINSSDSGLEPVADPSQDINENLGPVKMANVFALLTKYDSGDQIKNNEKGGECSTYGRQERCIWWGDLTERDHLEDLGVDERIILKWIFKKRNEESWTGLIWLRIGRDGGRW
jgi:hypothetical protein